MLTENPPHWYASLMLRKYIRLSRDLFSAMMARLVRSAWPFMDWPKPATMRADFSSKSSSCGVGFFLTFSLLTFGAGFLSYAPTANPFARWALLKLVPSTANVKDSHGFANMAGVLED